MFLRHVFFLHILHKLLMEVIFFIVLFFSTALLYTLYRLSIAIQQLPLRKFMHYVTGGFYKATYRTG